MLLLRAVARDGAVRPALERALSSDDAAARALAAQGLEAVGDAGAVRALTAALEHETDDETFRRSTSALASLGGTHPVRPLVARFADEEVAPEAMLLAASELESESRSTRRRVGAALRRALHASEPRVRVGAAWALAVSGDRSAFRALGVALDDREPEVRHAVARALAILREPLARPLLEARARIEEDPIVREALVDALELDRRFPAAGLRGNETLRVRIRTTSGRAHGPVPVDVVLPDGRYLRLRTLASGELILVDLPLGTADVRARVEG
jgi:HEAT repeat protein